MKFTTRLPGDKEAFTKIATDFCKRPNWDCFTEQNVDQGPACDSQECGGALWKVATEWYPGARWLLLWPAKSRLLRQLLGLRPEIVIYPGAILNIFEMELDTLEADDQLWWLIFRFNLENKKSYRILVKFNKIRTCSWRIEKFTTFEICSNQLKKNKISNFLDFFERELRKSVAGP